MKIVWSDRFSKEDSCQKLGLRHPVYILLEKLKELRRGEAVQIAVDDYDWAAAIETIVESAGFAVEKREEGREIVFTIWARQ